MTSRMVLALDLSTRTGWAAGVPGERPAHGILALPNGGGTGNIGAVMAALCDGLRDLLEVHQPARVIYEAPAMHMAARSPHTARMLICLAGAVDLMTYRWSIPCSEAQVATVRSRIMGSGRFPKGTAKAAVMEWCRGQGHHPQDDNAGDALLLLAYGHAVLPGMREAA